MLFNKIYDRIVTFPPDVNVLKRKRWCVKKHEEQQLKKKKKNMKCKMESSDEKTHRKKKVQKDLTTLG